jgi:glycosyltransferase involved in cell wall biosynthesis
MIKEYSYCRKKILFVSTGLRVGGAETILAQITSALKDEFEIEVISLTGDGFVASKIKSYGIAVHVLDLKKIYLFPVYIYKFFSIVSKFNPNIIQGWMYHGNVFAYLARRFCSKKAKLFLGIRRSLERISIHNFSTSCCVFFNAFISKTADKVIYNSYAGKEQHEEYGFCKKKSIVIHNGINTELFCKSRLNHDALCAELQIDSKSILIGMIGNFRVVKDHKTFIRAAGMLLSTNNNVHYVMVGSGVDKNNAYLKNLINKHSILEKHFHLLGPRKDIAYITSALDIANNCSLSEGFSNSIAESLSCGVPCVVTDVGESRRIIGDKRFIVPVGAHEQFVDAWKKILKMSQRRRMEYGVLLRKKIITLYSLDKMIYTYRDVFSKI